MKKLFLILAAFSTLAASSQTKELDNLNKRLAKSDATVADPKKAGSITTWIEHAEALLAASNAYTSTLIAGFSIEQTMTLLGQEPTSIEEAEVSGKTHKKYIFDNYDIYVDENGQVAFWNAKNEFRPGAMKGSFDALKKAYEIDPSGFASKGYLTGSKILNQFNTDGMNLYNLDKKAEAADIFAKVVETNAMLGNTDSTMIYYTGVAYSESGNYDKALEYMNKAKEIGYEQDGGTDFYISYIQQQQGKKEDAIATIESAMVKYPTDQRMTTQLINLYMETKRSPDKIVSMLQKAKELDPKNVSLFMVEGNLWEQMGDSKKAKEAFLAATEADSNNFIGYMNAGILTAREGDKLIEKANKLDVNDIKGYNALVDQAVPFYDEAIKYLEKAHELNPKDAGVVGVLKGLYFPKRDETPELGARFKYFDDLYKTMQE